MVELDFRGCTTKEDVEKVFTEKKVYLKNEMENLEKFGDRYLALQSIERGKGISAMPPGHPQIG